MEHDGTGSPLADGPSVLPGCLTRLLADLAAAPAHPAVRAPMVGDRLGRFVLRRQIGHGGFGLVFEAEDTELRRRVALKVVRPHHSDGHHSTPAEWLRQEAEAAAQFRHPNVVTLYDAGLWEGGTYLVYELLRGQTLAEKLASGPLPRAEAVRVLRELAGALAHLHAAGVVHRDVKAANVFVDEGGAVKLLDLGLAQIAGSAGYAAGSPPYAAPEQWRGERADARADVYAWGVLAHQLVTGALPSAPPTAGPQTAKSLQALIAKARSPDAALRPADGGALTSALASIDRRRSRLRALRLGGLAVAAIAATLVLAWPTEREIARNVSVSLEAYQQYAIGRRCMDRPSEGASWMRLDCAKHFRDALAIDPDFPLAHFELASLARWDSQPSEAIEEVFRRALRQVERLPAREQAQLRAWKADLDGDHEESLRILRGLVGRYPQDARAALSLGEALYRLGRHAEAAAPLDRALALDPSLELAADELAWSLGFVDRTDELRALAGRMAAMAPSPGVLHAEVLARGWTGDLDRALAIARRAAVGGGGAAREDLEDVLVAIGQFDEAERLLREDLARGADRAAHRLESLLLLRGRLREARELMESLPRSADPHWQFVVGARRANRFAAAKDTAAIERVIDEARGWSPEVAAILAPLLAYGGNPDRAEALLPDVRDEPGVHELTRAIVSWHRAGAAAALPQLRRLARADPTSTPAMPPEAPSWVAAEAAVEAGAPDALEDVRRFQRFYFPLGLWRAWAYPRSLLVEARLHAEASRAGDARAALDRLEALLAPADPGLPLLAEARALRARVDAGGSIAAEVSGRRGP